jgi:predicted O-methyltransferase YrrM
VAALCAANDARETERNRRMLSITPDTGQLLSILVRAMRARRVLEVGTSSGYSTLWLAWACTETDGHVDTIEIDHAKIALASSHFVRAQLAERITQHHGMALETLRGLDEPFDLIFLDADRANYMQYFEHLLRLLRPGGLLVTDNVISHAHELTEFLPRVRGDPRLLSVLLPVGNGEELTYRLP